jgi:hypothetical protein
LIGKIFDTSEPSLDVHLFDFLLAYFVELSSLHFLTEQTAVALDVVLEDWFDFLHLVVDVDLPVLHFSLVHELLHVLVVHQVRHIRVYSFIGCLLVQLRSFLAAVHTANFVIIGTFHFLIGPTIFVVDSFEGVLSVF